MRTSDYVRTEEMSGPMDVLLPVLAIGGIIGVGYILYTKGTGIYKTGGSALDKVWDTQKLVSDSIGDTIGGAQKWFGDFVKWNSDFDKSTYANLDKIGSQIGNAGCHIQRGFGLLFGTKGPECRGSGELLSRKDDRIIALHMLTASDKPYPKITNNVYNTLVRMGVDPRMI